MSAGKALKTIALTAVAQDHHNAIKIKNIAKWLKSGHEVRIQISGKSDRQKAMENIFKQVEGTVKSGARVVQKVVKPDSIKFYLKPTPDAANMVIEEDHGNEMKDLDDIIKGKDILSDDFVSELEKSIKDDKKMSKRK
jgi:hypothetical protein